MEPAVKESFFPFFSYDIYLFLEVYFFTWVLGMVCLASMRTVVFEIVWITVLAIFLLVVLLEFFSLNKDPVQKCLIATIMSCSICVLPLG